jgi:hypothetical protein
MGKSAKCNVAIFLKEGTEMPLGITSATATQQSMLTHYYAKNPDASEPHIFVDEHEQYDNSVELELYSTREQNLDFQVDLLEDYLQQFSDIIEEVTYDKWVQAD